MEGATLAVVFFGIMLMPVTFLAGGFTVHVAFDPEMHEFADTYFVVGGVASTALAVLAVYAMHKAESCKYDCLSRRKRHQHVPLRNLEELADEDTSRLVDTRRSKPQVPFGGKSVYPVPVDYHQEGH